MYYWAQEAQDNVPTPRGTWMATYDNCIILFWNQGKSKCTIFLSTNTNTPSTRTASGTMSYRAYSAVIKAFKACTPHSCREHVLQRPNHQGPPNDSNELIAEENLLWDPHCNNGVFEETSADDIPLKFSNVTTDATDEDRDTSKVEKKGQLTLDPFPEREQDEQHVPLDSDKQAELMHWHYRLGHLSFPKLKILAKIGKIPKRLVNVKPPVCT